MKNRLLRLAKLATFLMVLIPVHVVLCDLCIEKGYGQADPLRCFREYKALNELPNVLVMGNSHMLCGMDCSLLPRTQRVDYFGESYIASYYKLKKLIAYKGAPKKAVVLQLDMTSFTSDPVEIIDNPYSALYIDHLDLARKYGHASKAFWGWFEHCVFPYASQGPSICRALLSPDDAALDEALRFQKRRFSDVIDQDREAEQRAVFHMKPGMIWKQQASLDSFKGIADLCQVNGLALVWVRIPTSREYYTHIRQLVPVEKWQALVDSLLKEYPNIVLLDYHDLLFDRNELFLDPNHLNADGAKVFTERIREEFVRRGFLTQ